MTANSVRAVTTAAAVGSTLVHDMLIGMEPLDEVLRARGHYGPRVDVATNADEQSRLLAFTGRRP